jgi:hypothetical protein
MLLASIVICLFSSAERPLSESESVLLSKICSWKRKIVVVVNKLDIIRDRSDRALLLDFVSQNVARIVGSGDIEPVPVFGVSGRQALEATLGTAGDVTSVNGSRMQLLLDSNIQSIQRYLLDRLNRDNIVRDKLQNPVRMMERMVEIINESVEKRSVYVEGDKRVIEFIQESSQSYAADVKRGCHENGALISKLAVFMVERLKAFLDAQLRLNNIRNLSDEVAITERIKEDVILDMSRAMDSAAAAICHQLEQSAIRQKSRIIEYVGDRGRRYGKPTLFAASLISGDERLNSENKNRALNKIREELKDRFFDYSRDKEAAYIGRGVASDAQRTLLLLGASGGLLASSVVVAVFQIELMSSWDGLVGAVSACGLGAGAYLRWQSTRAVLE